MGSDENHMSSSYKELLKARRMHI